MTIKMIGVPQLSLLDLTLLSETVGAPFEFLIKSSSPNNLRHYWPLRLTVYSAIRLLYIDSLDGYRNWLSLKKEDDTLVLIKTSPTELLDYGVELYQDGVRPVDADDLSIFLRMFDRLPSPPVLDKAADSTAALIRDKSRESLLSKLQSSFYRVKDKDERLKIQTQSYRFLILKSKTPDTGWDHIDRILSSDIARRFKEALRYIKSEADIDDIAKQFEIDRFELTFVLKKLNRV